jgi:NAD(P)-dependent dehydrogenase (short-subunit alcohol dehydrogenase family)
MDTSENGKWSDLVMPARRDLFYDGRWQKSLNGKVAIVTGGASGLGRSTAEIMAADGAAVLIADLNREGADEVADALRARGLSAASTSVDLGDERQIQAMVETAVATFDRLDILHNNAALTGPDVAGRDGALTDVDASLYARVLQVNLIGAALAAKYAIPYMLRSGGGVVINMSSTDGQLAERVRLMYGTSKGGLNALTRSIATQFGRQGIRAVGIAPGVIVTEGARAAVPPEMIDRLNRHNLTPRGGIPEDIGHLASFLASDKAAFITGITIPVDGGLTAHFPNYAEEIDAELATE